LERLAVCRERASNGSWAEQTGITADTTRRLSKALGTKPELRMNPQNSFDVTTTMLYISKGLDNIQSVSKAPSLST
jgi:plasmid maintenance system antidote protein VapI